MINKEQHELLNLALQTAINYHWNQLDKSGQPYIYHPMRVALMAQQLGLDIETQCIGLLHDLVEDTECTLKRVHDMFGKRIGDGVDAMTRRNKKNAIVQIIKTEFGVLDTVTTEEKYFDFVRRVALNPDARKVKPLDNADNMRPERVVKLEGTDFSLPKRYHKSVNLCLDACIQAGEEDYVRKFKELVTWM